MVRGGGAGGEFVGRGGDVEQRRGGRGSADTRAEGEAMRVRDGVRSDTGWGGYWARDVARHGARWPSEDGEAERGLWGGLAGVCGARELVWGVWVLAGVVAGLMVMEGMLRAGVEAGWVGVAAVLMWGPWLLGGLGVVHVVRAAVMRWRVEESEAAFVARVCGGKGGDGANGADAEVALAVRRALATVYGVREGQVRSWDTAWGLSWWMERPGRAEFCEAFLRTWGSGRSAWGLARGLGEHGKVAGLVHAVGRAV